MNGFCLLSYQYELNENFVFQSLSHSVAHMLGVLGQHIEGIPYQNLKNTYDGLDDFVKQFLANTTNKNFVYTAKTTGQTLLVTLHSVENNSILCLFQPSTDLATVLNSSLDPLNLFYTIFQHTIDACFLIENGVFIGCNPSAVKLWHAPDNNAIIGKKPGDISPERQECGTLSQIKAQQMMDRAKEKGSHLFDWIHLRFDNTLLYSEVSLTYIQINNKDYFLTIIRDISEKRNRETALLQSEKQYRLLAENTDDVIWLLSPNLETIYISPSIEEFSGYSANEFKQLSLQQLLTTKSFELFDNTLKKQLKNINKQKKHRSFTLQLEHLHKNGQIVWGELNINFVDNQKNEIQEILIAIRNITDRKQIENELLNEKEKFRAIVEAFDGFIYICSPDHIVEYMNDKLIQRTGFDGTGKKCHEVLHGLHDICGWCVNEQIQQGKSLKWEVKSPKDNRWYSISNTPIFRSDGRISKQAMIQDITDTKLAEIAIRESEAKFRALAENTPLAVFIYQGHKFKYVNPALTTLTKYSKEELLAMNFYDLVHPDYYNIVKNRGLKRQTGQKIIERYEFKVLTKDKQELWIDFTGTYIEYEGAGAALGAAYDITERKNAEKALKSSEEKYRLLVHNQSDLIFKIDANGCFEYVSPSYCQTFGKKESQLIGQSFFPVVHEDDVGITLDAMQKLKVPPYSCTFEHRTLTTKGWRWLSWSNKSIFDNKKRFQAVIGVGRDITERKEAELALAKSEERFRSLVELAVDGIALGDENGIIVDVNKRFLEITGRKRKDVVGKEIHTLFTAEELQLKPLQFEALNSGKTITSEREIIRPDGKTVVVEMHSKRMPDKTYQAFFRDITLRKESEMLLKEQKRFLETLIGNLPGLVYRCKNDKSWTMEFISGRCRELTGYPPSDFIQNKKRTFESIIHPQHRGRLWESWQEALKKKQIFADEYVIITADGTEKWVFEQGTGVFDENNNIIALEGFIMDITDRKIAEEAMLKSQFNFKMLAGYNQLLSKASLVFAMAETLDELEMMIVNYFQQLTGAALILLMQYNKKTQQFVLKKHIVQDKINSKILEIFGEEAYNTRIKINEQVEKQMLQQGIIKTEHIEDVSFNSFDPDLLRQLEAETQICEIIVTVIQRQNNLIGKLSAFLQQKSQVPDEVLKTFSQIAGFALTRKKTELDLIEAKNKAEMSDKMKSVFLANISHEIKSPMNAILGFTELLEKPNLEYEERLKYTEIITKAGNQLLIIIDDLIDLAKIESGQMKIIYSKFDVIPLLYNLFDMLRPKFKSKGLDFELITPENITSLFIESDAIRLKQILMNLLDNAYKYTISGFVHFGFTVFDNFIRFYVKDTGIGIAPSDSERIFERFVKLDEEHASQQSGKGLGLSISKSLAEMLGGQIHLESAIHKGSVFYLTLPIKKNN